MTTISGKERKVTLVV
jgi:hypothetical protein